MESLNIHLEKQKDGISSGQCSVVMVKGFFDINKYRPFPTDDPIFKKYQQPDGRLDSMGIACALRDILGGGVFYATSGIDNPNGITALLSKSPGAPLFRNAQKQVMISLDNKRIILKGWDLKAGESPMKTLGAIFWDYHLPSIVNLDHNKINPECKEKHSVVVTKVDGSEVFYNSPCVSGEEVKADRKASVDAFINAWAGADFDLIVYSPSLQDLKEISEVEGKPEFPSKRMKAWLEVHNMRNADDLDPISSIEEVTKRFIGQLVWATWISQKVHRVFDSHDLAFEFKETFALPKIHECFTHCMHAIEVYKEHLDVDLRDGKELFWEVVKRWLLRKKREDIVKKLETAFVEDIKTMFEPGKGPTYLFPEHFPDDPSA